MRRFLSIITRSPKGERAGRNSSHASGSGPPTASGFASSPGGGDDLCARHADPERSPALRGQPRDDAGLRWHGAFVASGAPHPDRRPDSPRMETTRETLGAHRTLQRGPPHPTRPGVAHKRARCYPPTVHGDPVVPRSPDGPVCPRHRKGRVMNMARHDPFGALAALTTPTGSVEIHRLDRSPRSSASRSSACLLDPDPARAGAAQLRRVPGHRGRREAARRWSPPAPAGSRVPFKPARVILQDFTGVPCVVDLAAMRDAMKRLGGDPKRINPLVPVDLVIDHSVQVDVFGNVLALEHNAEIEFERNRERYEFLRWGQKAFSELPRGAARDRDRAPGEPRVPRAGRAHAGGDGGRVASPTRWWAPTPTRR